ncbi:MAG: hypothetical protein LUC91_11240, partial [Prevotella sp.]|nr:hypothetical protein [Prevotella sp.]
KIPWAGMPVRVRTPSGALLVGKPSQTKAAKNNENQCFTALVFFFYLCLSALFLLEFALNLP